MVARVEKYSKYLDVVTNYDKERKIVQRVNDSSGDSSIPIVK